MLQKNLRRSLGWTLIGDGTAGMIWPKQYLRKLESGPAPLRGILEAFAERPKLTRALCAGEVALGLWIVFGLKNIKARPLALE